MYEQIETDITNKLTPDLTGVDVVKMPESQADFKRTFINARVQVSYKGSKFGDNPSNMIRATDNIVQHETICIEVAISSRFLRQPDKGIFGVFSKVKKSLLGFTPTNCDRMILKSFEYDSFEESYFTYVAEFECTSLAVEDFEEPFLSPAITQITTELNLINE